MKLDTYRNLQLNYIDIEKCISPPLPEEEEDDDTIVFDVTVTLLREVTEGGYNRLREKLIKTQWTQIKKIPTFHILKKSPPKEQSLKMIPVITVVDEMGIIEYLESDDPFISVSMDDLIESIENANDTLASSKICGTYIDFVNMMIQKYRNRK